MKGREGASYVATWEGNDLSRVNSKSKAFSRVHAYITKHWAVIWESRKN
jgi:hypothetical protein